jgi:hypothetical protein
MPDRRQFLAAAAAVPLSAVQGAVVLPCAAPTPGAVTAQSGFLTSLVDAAGLGKQGAVFQWQYGVVCSDKAGACAHYRANQIVENEQWLIVTLIGSRDPQDFQPCPYPTTPVTLTVGQATNDGAGNLYTTSAAYKPHNGSCRGTQQDATAGTVTYTLVSDVAVEASYDLTFPAGTVQGTFVAPVCDMAGCPPRPTKSTCVTA